MKKKNKKKASEIAKENEEVIKSISEEVFKPLRKRNRKKEEEAFNSSLDILDDDGIDELINSFKPLDKKTINQMKGFVKIAKLDLNQAQKAYIENDTNYTLWHLQQSIEKIVKAYGLKLRIIKRPEKIRHDTPLVYVELLKYSWVDKVAKTFNLKANPKKSIEYLESLINSKEDMVKLDKDIPLLVKEFKLRYKKIEKKLSKRDMKKTLELGKIVTGIDYKDLFLTNTHFGFLCPLAVITTPYAVDPRYEINENYSQLNLITQL